MFVARHKKMISVSPFVSELEKRGFVLTVPRVKNLCISEILAFFFLASWFNGWKMLNNKTCICEREKESSFLLKKKFPYLT